MVSGVILDLRSPSFKVTKHHFYYQRTDVDKMRFSMFPLKNVTSSKPKWLCGAAENIVVVIFYLFGPWSECTIFSLLPFIFQLYNRANLIETDCFCIRDRFARCWESNSITRPYAKDLQWRKTGCCSDYKGQENIRLQRKALLGN